MSHRQWFGMDADPVKAPKPSVEEGKAKEKQLDAALPQAGAIVPGTDGPTAGADAPEVAPQGLASPDGGKPSLKQHLEEQAANFARPTTRTGLLKDWKAPQKPGDLVPPVATAVAAPAGASTPAVGQGVASALDEAGDKKGGLAGVSSPGNSATVKAVAAKPEAAEGASSHQALPVDLSRSRLDSVPETVYSDDIMASTNSLVSIVFHHNWDEIL